jgi:Superfamily II DNA and RNA helicases
VKNTEYKFGDLELSPKVLAGISDMGFEEPSPIQKQAIPFALTGKDIIGQAQTGTGKTAAFGIPILEKLQGLTKYPQALIIAPTRELALQVAEELAKIGRHKRVKVAAIYGGQSMERQIRVLQGGVHIVVGTPGRLLDHLNRKTLKLEQVETFVLDEADEMLDMGFIDDIESILRQAPEEKQMLLFSATMVNEVRRLAEKYMKQPVFVTVNREQVTVPLIEQVYYETRNKLESLCRILDAEETERLIIFCRTKKGVADLVASLQSRGYGTEGLHGDLSQFQRERAMKRFRDGKAEILVATDVAARGIDIENISHVINYDIPQDNESYVHRIGRTGRAGRKGKAITLVEPIEFRQLRSIQLAIKTKIVRQPLPTLADVLDKQKESLGKALRLIIESGAHKSYKSILKDMPDEFEYEDLAAATLCYHLEGIPEIARPKEPKFPDTGAAPGQVRFFINMGQVQKVTQEDIIKKIAFEADLSSEAVAKVRVYEAFSFLEVPEEEAEKVFAVMNKNMWKGYRVRLEPARGRDNSRPRLAGAPQRSSRPPASSRPIANKKPVQGGTSWKNQRKN